MDCKYTNQCRKYIMQILGHDLIDFAMSTLDEMVPLLEAFDRERTEEILQTARLAGKRCDQLLVELAKTDFNAAETTAMVLLTRFHKRIIGHSFNILSSVVMPLPIKIMMPSTKPHNQPIGSPQQMIGLISVTNICAMPMTT